MKISSGICKKLNAQSHTWSNKQKPYFCTDNLKSSFVGTVMHFKHKYTNEWNDIGYKV